MRNRFYRLGLLGIVTATFVFRVAGDDKPYDRQEALAKYRRPASVPCPEDNRPSAARVDLGKRLFFDPRLSGPNSISCASCHNPAFSWGDGLPKGVGFGSKELGRRTPTILNVAFGELMFWDGRAASLEEQALGPIQSPGEMNQPLEGMVTKLQNIPGYQPLFEKAYPGEPIAPATIAKAIATFERTVISEKAPFDDWVTGNESAISASAKRGFDLFNTKANCAACHTGWNFTDDGFHDIGLVSTDIGRGKHLPQVEAVQFAFKTPTLRNADRRAPYMHDGSEKSLEEVVDYYTRGGTTKRPSLAQEIKPFVLTSGEKDDLCNFIRTLTSNDQPVSIPTLP
ncbi:MAG TPA: cytochrome c peroxidase [Candidatus Limnocylindria bacterium]|jgi:cytochrome c peroxidase|nr:cytochrome c peroxidase [Candidatus Limnocylindria bacterium]